MTALKNKNTQEISDVLIRSLELYFLVQSTVLPTNKKLFLCQRLNLRDLK